MTLTDIHNYLKYDPTSSTFLRWVKAKSKNTNPGDEAGCLYRNTFQIIYNKTNYKSAQIIYYLHHGILPEKIKFLDGNRRNLSIDNLIPVEKKPKVVKRRRVEINIEDMKQQPIQSDTIYKWTHKNDMILILDENEKIVRKFKNVIIQDEDFVIKIRENIILRFGIAPKFLKEVI